MSNPATTDPDQAEQPARPGRPRRAERREHRIQVLLTAAEEAALRRMAAEHGEDLSACVRRAIRLAAM